VLNHTGLDTLNLVFADKKKGWQRSASLVGNFGQRVIICLYVRTTSLTEQRTGFLRLSLELYLTSNLTVFEMPGVNLHVQTSF
jgi:hypothetical protein